MSSPVLLCVCIRSLHARKSGDNPTIHADPEAEGRYLDLEQLGNVLLYLSGALQGKAHAGVSSYS